MQTRLADWARDTDFGTEADAILRRCTHCGFCLSACPTFQILGDELDSPRGRIYQMKLVLESVAPTAETQRHLDRCLTCHACETVCPSGVKYGELVDIGREVVDRRVQRSMPERLRRSALRHLMSAPWFGILYRIARWVRPVLPAVLKAKVLPARRAGRLPANPQRHRRQVSMLASCVQPAMLPSVDAATRRVLDALGIGSRYARRSGCCGAINFHLGDQEAARVQMRANIDAWLPSLESGDVEAVVVNASGCGGMLKDYARHLRHDPVYGERAARLMPYVKDIAELLAPMAGELRTHLRAAPGSFVFHAPCTLQHWQGLHTVTERLLRELGFQVRPVAESTECCGSAGTYSLTQPALSLALRDRKLADLAAPGANAILSANVGCIGHLQSGTDVPVRHWIEVVDAALR